MKNDRGNKPGKKTAKLKHFWGKRWLGSLILGIIPVFTAVPATAAERVMFNYGPLLLEIEVSSLEQFAKEGKINRELAFYMKRVDEPTREAFRMALNRRQEVNAIELYRFFKTPMGEEMLDRIGNFVTIPGGRNGKYAIRAAIGKAAFDRKEGLTLLNFLRQFPTDIYLDIDRIFELADSVGGLVAETDRVVGQIEQLSLKEAKSDGIIDYSQLPDLRSAGQYEYSIQTLNVFDRLRNRKFEVDIYKPTALREGKTPVIVASHGLASNRKHFEKIARHLTSYGYVVAVPEHIGSNYTHFTDMLEGLNRSIFNLNEFIDRPKDVSFVLDELERRNQREFKGKLDLERVGVLGHSFGGYTALALAGAEINFEQLEKDCDREMWSPNLSLLLQCQAIKLPRQTYNLRDPRVGVVMVVNPVNSTIFGQKSLSSIEIPLMFASGSDDPATPAVIEQVQSFTWLTNQDRYLLLLEGQAHLDVSELDAGATQIIESVTALKFPQPGLIDRYDNAMTLGFFEYHLANNREYRPYLQSSYTKYLSEEPFGLYMVQSLSSQKKLQETIAQFNTQEKRDRPKRERDPS